MSIPVKKRSLLLLFGSPHGQGFTRRLAEAYLQPFRACGDWEVTQVDAYALNASPCLGCGACQKAEACALPDLDGWDRQLRQCDLLVVAGPVYNCSFPPLCPPHRPAHHRQRRLAFVKFQCELGLAPGLPGLPPPRESGERSRLLQVTGDRHGFSSVQTAGAAVQLQYLLRSQRKSVRRLDLQPSRRLGSHGEKQQGQTAPAQ